MRDDAVKNMIDTLDIILDQSANDKNDTLTAEETSALYRISIDYSLKVIEDFRKLYHLTSDVVDDFDGHPLTLI